MTPDKIYIEETVDAFFRRCMAARAAGGIPMYEVAEGKTTIPPDYLPANISLL